MGDVSQQHATSWDVWDGSVALWESAQALQVQWMHARTVEALRARVTALDAAQRARETAIAFPRVARAADHAGVRVGLPMDAGPHA